MLSQPLIPPKPSIPYHTTSNKSGSEKLSANSMAKRSMPTFESMPFIERIGETFSRTSTQRHRSSPSNTPHPSENLVIYIIKGLENYHTAKLQQYITSNLKVVNNPQHLREVIQKGEEELIDTNDFKNFHIILIKLVEGLDKKTLHTIKTNVPRLFKELLSKIEAKSATNLQRPPASEDFIIYILQGFHQFSQIKISQYLENASPFHISDDEQLRPLRQQAHKTIQDTNDFKIFQIILIELVTDIDKKTLNNIEKKAAPLFQFLKDVVPQGILGDKTKNEF